MLATAGIGLPATAQPVSHDFNADGYSDFPVSLTGYEPADPVTGAARIWSGSSKTVIHTIVAPDTNTLFGWSVGSAGDIDADGYDDLIVGEPLWNPTAQLNGRIHVFSGDDASTLLTVVGPYTETALGRYVAGIGDWNGDGTPDIAASGWDIADLDSDGVGDDPIGVVYVLSGTDGAILAEISDPTATEMFGYSVFGLGDITGDGFADIAVSDRHAVANPGSGSSGELYIFAGGPAASVLTLTDVHSVLTNSNPDVRGYAAQVDVMHPDLWLGKPTLQIVSLTDDISSGGPNQSSVQFEIVAVDGTPVGSKGERSSLVLAGDVNLDGKVDAQDLQVSISQLGTNPQAHGVMPIADLNNDQIVDSADVALLLDGYGDTTDIYEGLWYGSRLLAVVGGNSGFGNISGGTISGSGHVEPGRRPIDDCPARSDFPSDSGTGLIPLLLRLDSRENCEGDCPGKNDPDPQGCWRCDDEGSLQGGTVRSNPSQPEPGQQFTFTASGVTDTGGTEKCFCGQGGTRSVPGEPVDYHWQVVTRNPDGSWPDFNPNNWHPGAVTNPITAEACKQYKAYFLVTPTRSECQPDLKIIEGVTSAADFHYEIHCYADGSVRDTVGVRELLNIKIVPPTRVVWPQNGVGFGSPGRCHQGDISGSDQGGNRLL